MRTLLHLVLGLFLILALSASANAQCSAMPGTGCAGQTNPVCGTPPAIGTNFIFRCPPTCFPSTSQWIVIGTPMAPTPLPSPPMCTTDVTAPASLVAETWLRLSQLDSMAQTAISIAPNSTITMAPMVLRFI